MTYRDSKTISQPMPSIPAKVLPERIPPTIRVPEDFEHVVQFYETDDFLAEQTGEFIGAGLKAGEAAIVFCTSMHLEGLEARLKAMGFDIQSLKADRQLVHLDARETLGKFLVDNMPDEALFRQVVGSRVAEMLAKRPGLRAVGEMVALLWSEGNREAACRLEDLWNGLSKAHAFSLFCAYPMKAFVGGSNAADFENICNHHSRAVPSGGFTTVGLTAGERLHSIALLQQKAASLESEIQVRKDMEAALLEAKDALEQQLEDVQKLHELSGRLMTATELDPVLREVLQATLAVYHTDKGALYLVDSKRDGLRLAVQIGLTDEAMGAWHYIEPGVGSTGTCYKNRLPVMVQDVETDPAYAKYREGSRLAGFRSVHSTPLINRDEKILGVLTVCFNG